MITFLPLVGCIAAGCPAVLKPSEHCPFTSALIAKLVPQYLDPQAYVVVQGAAEQASALLDLPWGHIFFTGSIPIGRVVAEKASKHITPVTLELGGKSPAVVDPGFSDVELAAKRILWGKYNACGQVWSSCFRPNIPV